MIRRLERNEYHAAVELSLQAYIKCGKADFDEEGLNAFKSYIYDEKQIDALTMYGAFENNGELAGLSGLKTAANIFHYFS